LVWDKNFSTVLTSTGSEWSSWADRDKLKPAGTAAELAKALYHATRDSIEGIDYQRSLLPEWRPNKTWQPRGWKTKLPHTSMQTDKGPQKPTQLPRVATLPSSATRPKIFVCGSLGRRCEMIVHQTELWELCDKVCQELDEPSSVACLYRQNGQILRSLAEIQPGEQLFIAPPSELRNAEKQHGKSRELPEIVSPEEYGRLCIAAQKRALNPNPVKIRVFRSEWTEQHGDKGREVPIRGTWDHLLDEVTQVLHISERPRRLFIKGGKGISSLEEVPPAISDGLAQIYTMPPDGQGLYSAEAFEIVTKSPPKSKMIHALPDPASHPLLEKTILLTPKMGYKYFCELLTKLLDHGLAVHRIYHPDGTVVKQLSELSDGALIYGGWYVPINERGETEEYLTTLYPGGAPRVYFHADHSKASKVVPLALQKFTHELSPKQVFANLLDVITKKLHLSERAKCLWVSRWEYAEPAQDEEESVDNEEDQGGSDPDWRRIWLPNQLQHGGHYYVKRPHICEGEV